VFDRWFISNRKQTVSGGYKVEANTKKLTFLVVFLSLFVVALFGLAPIG